MTIDGDTFFFLLFLKYLSSSAANTFRERSRLQ